MTAVLTSSGIPGLRDVAWGEHVCHLYGARGELAESLVPFFKAGLDSNEACIWITSKPLPTHDARGALLAAVPQLAAFEQSGQLLFVDHHDWYTDERTEDPRMLIDAMLAHEQQALAAGYHGLRINGDTYDVPPGPLWNAVVEYERMVNTAIRDRRVVALCSYCIEHQDAALLLSVLPHHHYSVIKRGSGWEIMESESMRMAREELARLRSAAELREQFLGMVAHDLRNPLNSILLAAQMLMEPAGMFDEDAHREICSRVAGSAQRMSRLINDLADFTRARLGQELPLQPAPDDINAICRAVCEELELVHPASSILLDLRARGAGMWDRPRLARAISNMVGNALQYSTPGSTVTVRTHDADPEPGWRVGGPEPPVRVEIHNWGEPIPPDLMPRLFSPFHRGVHSDPDESVGLGLFIARRIVEAHRGRIEVRSSRESGTTFTIHLPRANSAEALASDPASRA